ncbi:MAG: hypothetical protein ACOY93_21400 [Bacillota bacterium]
MHKKLLSWLGTLLILTGTLLPAARVLAEQGGAAPQSGAWTLTSSGPVYANGQTTWTYTFAGSGRPQALDEMDIALCSGFDGSSVHPSHGGEVGPDGALGLPNAVQWARTDLRGISTVQVSYDGLWATGSQSWYIQAGADLYSGTVSGPSCDPLEPEFQITKTVSTSEADPGGSSLTLTGGGTVYYFYTITNTGNTRLAIDSAVDDRLGPVPFPQGEIAPGDSVTVTLSKSFPELEPGSPPQTEVNTVTATGSYAGVEVGPKAASATVINQPWPDRPNFTITKRVSATNDPTNGQKSITLDGGGTAYYFYTLVNTGNVPLTVEGASDDVLGPLTFSPGTVTVGGTATAWMSKSFDPPAPDDGPVTETNTVTVTVSHRGQALDPKSDTASVTVNPLPAAPSFAVSKRVNSINDAGTAGETITLVGGGTAWYFYTITNTGNVSLTVNTAFDDVLGPLTFQPAVLPPGGVATAAASKHFPAPAPGAAPETEVNTLVVTMLHRGEEVGPQTDSATVITQPAPEQPTGSFTVEKLVSAQDDWATGAKSITLENGGTAYYFYKVTNTGDLRLFIESAEDDQLGPITFATDELQPGESTTATASKLFPQLAPGAPDQTETNTLTVDVMYGNETNESKSDQATVINRAPVVEKEFTLTKRVNSVNDPATAQESITLENGGTAWYFYTVTNTGNVALSITDALDDILGPLTFSPATLAPGESATAVQSKAFEPLAPGSGSAIEVNTATVTVQFPDRTTATRTDQAEVVNQAVPANPDFTLTKRVSTANDPATGVSSITLTGGGTAYYFYTITNTGNVPLTITEASDDILGSLAFSPAVIPVGGTAAASASKSFAALPGGAPDQVETNTVVVTVTHDDQTPLSKSAQATVVNRAAPVVCCTPPSPITLFQVEKRASTVNDPATGKELLTLTGGGTVYFFYTVRNTGQTTLTIESATDDKLGALHFSPATIAPGQSATAVAEKSFSSLPPGTATQHETNTVSVSARNSAGILYGPLTARATVVNEAEAARPDFTVTKRASTNSDPATGATGLTLPAEGGKVYYFFTLTNTGNVPLTIAEAVDDKLGPVPFSPGVVPPGGKATATLTKQFSPSPTAQSETNLVTVQAEYEGVLYGPRTDAVTVQVAAQPLGSLEVRVVDGSPRNTGIFPAIPGATVTLSDGRTAKTDSTGRILFTHLPFGRYDATASAVDPFNPLPETLRSGSGAATLSESTPDEVITIVLAWDPPSSPPTPRAPSLRLSVCQTFTELGGEVRLTGPGGAAAAGTLQSDGSYLFTGLAAGTWTVTLLAPGLAEPVSRPIALREDGAVPENAYSMDLSSVCPTRTGSIAGRICSPKPPGAEITGTGPNGETASTQVGATGRLGEWLEYRLAHLLPGDWTLTLNTPGSPPVSQTVTVRAGEITRAPDFTLACTGQPAAGLNGLWFYLSGGLMVAAGLLLRRWARA